MLPISVRDFGVVVEAIETQAKFSVAVYWRRNQKTRTGRCTKERIGMVFYFIR